MLELSYMYYLHVEPLLSLEEQETLTSRLTHIERETRDCRKERPGKERPLSSIEKGREGALASLGQCDLRLANQPTNQPTKQTVSRERPTAMTA